MDFIQAENRLMKIFDGNDFINDVKLGKNHTTETVLEKCRNGTIISISFPGYKAYYTNYKTVYDYRVDITKNGVKTSLSHANIITDIYNKIINGKMCPISLKNTLIEAAQQNNNFLITEIEKKLIYTPVNPPFKLKNAIKIAHGSKQYNEVGNSFDLTMEEFFLSLKWIILQEDINYPIRKRYEGRKMPFARYLETIFITQNNAHSIEEVIRRTLTHSRSSRWSDMDYSFSDLIR